MIVSLMGAVSARPKEGFSMKSKLVVSAAVLFLWCCGAEPVGKAKDGPPISQEDVQTTPDGGDVDTDLCQEMSDGQFCEKGLLLTCVDAVLSEQVMCEHGCINTSAGMNDLCAAGAEEDPCASLGDGGHCFGHVLTTCVGNKSTESKACTLGCDSELGDCAETPGDPFCTTKVEGDFCAGDTLLTCANGKVSQKTLCPDGCLPGDKAGHDNCGVDEKSEFCADKAGSSWCVDDLLIYCSDGQISGKEECLNGCVESPGPAPDVCGPGGAESFCVDKDDGSWCKGPVLVTCDAANISKEELCMFPCVTGQPTGNDECGQPGNPEFCTEKQNGKWCKDTQLITCQGEQVVQQFECPWGCKSNAVGLADECASQNFCTSVPSTNSSNPPGSSCSYMDWELSPDGFYLVSKFGTDEDPTTWGNLTSCGYLQNHYNAKNCMYDQGTKACLSDSFDIPWTQGHVDYSIQQMVTKVSAHMDGDVPAPKYFYVAGAQRFGCGATLRVSNPDNGRCVVVYAEDGGPGAKYEGANYGGRRILDSSPAVIQYLQVKHLGWKVSDLLYVEWGKAGDVPGQQCSPCESLQAKAGSEENMSLFLVEHMVPGCGAAQQVGSCPSGNGLYCGILDGLDPNTLYLCTDGNYAMHEVCANGCQQSAAGISDSCVAGQDGKDECPNGDGAYCGGPMGLDANTLYYCSGGNFEPVQQCDSGCQQNAAGTPDACKGEGPSPIQDGKLVMCEPFNPVKAVTCSFGCYSGHKGSDYGCPNMTSLYSPITGTVTKVINTVNGQSCQPNFGNYVKIQQGVFEVILAHMNKDIKVSKGQYIDAGTHLGYASNTGYTMTYKNGKWVCQQGGGFHLHLEVRKNGVAFDGKNSSSVVWSAACSEGGSVEPPEKQCPSGNNTYCGEATGKTAGTLYQCINGQYTVLEVCANGCKQMPSGQADQCKSGSSGA
ncbi:MAG TPA: M23 family metallopeptidase, partial [Myxococcales bacterium]|nr:M23 family metallopeptidase [Myxococcales bacterium]